jgi:hypothetical protein
MRGLQPSSRSAFQMSKQIRSLSPGHLATYSGSSLRTPSVSRTTRNTSLVAGGYPGRNIEDFFCAFFEREHIRSRNIMDENLVPHLAPVPANAWPDPFQHPLAEDRLLPWSFAAAHRHSRTAAPRRVACRAPKTCRGSARRCAC